MYARARRTRPRAAAVLDARRERRRRISTSKSIARRRARAVARRASPRRARRIAASPRRHRRCARVRSRRARASRAARPARRDATLEFSRRRDAPIRVVESVNIARRGVRRVDVASARRVRRKSRNASRHTDTKKRSRKSDGNARRHFFAMRSPASKARRWVRARDDDGDDAVTVTVEARPRGEKEKRRRGTAVDALRDGSDDLRDGTRWYIDPRHAPRMAWDRASVVFVMFNMIVLPFDAAFWAGAPASLGVRVTRGVGYFIDAFFGVDVVLNFYTAYYDASDRLVRSRELIARNYVFSGAFFVDLCGSFPLFRRARVDPPRARHGERRRANLLRITRPLRGRFRPNLGAIPRARGVHGSRSIRPLPRVVSSRRSGFARIARGIRPAQARRVPRVSRRASPLRRRPTARPTLASSRPRRVRRRRLSRRHLSRARSRGGRPRGRASRAPRRARALKNV